MDSQAPRTQTHGYTDTRAHGHTDTHAHGHTDTHAHGHTDTRAHGRTGTRTYALWVTMVTLAIFQIESDEDLMSFP